MQIKIPLKLSILLLLFSGAFVIASDEVQDAMLSKPEMIIVGGIDSEPFNVSTDGYVIHAQLEDVLYRNSPDLPHEKDSIQIVVRTTSKQVKNEISVFKKGVKFIGFLTHQDPKHPYWRTSIQGGGIQLYTEALVSRIKKEIHNPAFKTKVSRPAIEKITFEPINAYSGQLNITIVDPIKIQNIYDCMPFNDPPPAVGCIDYNGIYKVKFLGNEKILAEAYVLYNYSGWNYNNKQYQLCGDLKKIIE